MAQNVPYSTIVMVNFKQKSYVVKSDSLFIVKSRIESHMSVYGGIDNYIYFKVNREIMHVNVHIITINRFQSEG